METSKNNGFVPQRKRPRHDPYLVPRADMAVRWFGASVTADDPRWEALERATMRADPLADDVATWLCERGAEGRKVFEELLEDGSNRADVAAPLARLFAQVNEAPPWLDRERVAVGTSTIARQAGPGQLSLTVLSLLTGYLSSTVNKPLLFTGALASRAPRRVAETAQFVHALAMSGRLERWSSGFKSAVRVRVMHALVRRRLLAMPNWQIDPWGIPINQRDMIATHLAFTMAYIFGLTMQGAFLIPSEVEGLLHAWRYVSFLLGAEDGLVPKTFREGMELVDLYNRSEPGPDEGSLQLGVALRESWEMAALPIARMTTGFARFALGERLSRQLGVPDTRWKHAAPVLAALNLVPSLASFGMPGARSRAVRRGKALMTHQITSALGGRPATFVPS